MAEPFVRIEPLNVQRVAEMFRDAPALAADEFETAMWLVTQQLAGEVKDRTPEGVGGGGGLKGNIFGEARLQTDGILGVVGTTLEHGIYVELGTGPRDKWPKIEPLKDWVKQKFALGTEEEIDRAAFLVARKIKAHGTPARRMFQTAFEANRERIEQRFGLAVDRILTRMADEGGA